MTKSVTVNLQLPTTRGRADWGASYDYGDGETHVAYRSCAVGADGSISVYDEIADAYTIHHDLTDAEIETLREMAAKVWAGTHYTSGGHLIERGRAEVL
jgi:hypothetical protein